MTLISQRRLGKTALISHCFEQEIIKDNFYTFYFDILHPIIDGDSIDIFLQDVDAAYRGEEVHADMVLYGHTHMPDLSADGPRLILNPGSLSRPRGGSVESCALVLLEGKDMTVRFVNADNEPLTR